MENKLKNAERTEEVQEIIDRMPIGIGVKITLFVLGIVVVFFSLGWIIKYPDVVKGAIIINASSSPIKLVSNSPGKLLLNGFKNFDYVKEGDYIAVLQNGTNLEDLKNVSLLVSQMNLKKDSEVRNLSSFSRNVSLGDLNTPYFRFLTALTDIVNYHGSNLYDKQTEVLNQSVSEYKVRLKISTDQMNMSVKNLQYVAKSHKRDSILFSKKVLSESENDRSEINLISAKDAHQGMLRDISNTRSQLQQTENQLQQVKLQKQDKAKQLELDLVTSFTELKDNIKAWEQKYVFKAPIDGKIQFLKFWTNNQYILSGEPIFTIIPIQKNVLGQMTLPARGSGKVKTGQEVIIKLEDYPYEEYGSIKGKVSSIGLTTNELQTKEGSIETYLVNVELPEKLKTNYGKQLHFKFEIKGSGDIITNQRRLIERLFDNLNYKLNE